MRKVSLALFATVLFAGTSVFANPVKDEMPVKSPLHSQIYELLKSNTFKVSEDLIAEVRFTLNQEGEIVVLSVETESESLERFVKGRLNYKKVDIDDSREGELYTVPVRMIRS